MVESLPALTECLQALSNEIDAGNEYVSRPFPVPRPVVSGKYHPYTKDNEGLKKVSHRFQLCRYRQFHSRVVGMVVVTSGSPLVTSRLQPQRDISTCSSSRLVTNKLYVSS